MFKSKARREAKQLIERSFVEYKGRPVGTPAALVPVEDENLNYNQVFTRDFFVTGLYFLLKGRTDIVENFLVTVAGLQNIEKSRDCFDAGQGLMPASFKVDRDAEREELKADFGEQAIGRVTPVDSGLWWVYLLRIHLRATGDESIIRKEERRSALRSVLDPYLSGYFELVPTLLVPDGAFMIDRRMGMYGHPLDIQVLFFIALRSAAEVLELDDSPDSEDYRKRIRHRLEHLYFHLENYYWLDLKRLNDIYRYKTEEFGVDIRNKYNIYSGSIPGWAMEFLDEQGGYYVGNLGPGRMDFRFLSSGNLLAVLGGLAGDEKVERLQNLISKNREKLVGRMPMKICYPALEKSRWEIVTGYDPKNAAWSYHNGGNWPFVAWMLAAVSEKCGGDLLGADQMEKVSERLRGNDWPEYYDGKDGALVGKEARLKQLWTITGSMAACEILEHPETLSLFCFDWEDTSLSCPNNRV